jgi:hypothetical protein
MNDLEAQLALGDNGSDCPTRKRQFATKRDAIELASSLRDRRGRSANAYRCAWCDCYHVGNKGGDTSKGRRRR